MASKPGIFVLGNVILRRNTATAPFAESRHALRARGMANGERARCESAGVAHGNLGTRRWSSLRRDQDATRRGRQVLSVLCNPRRCNQFARLVNPWDDHLACWKQDAHRSVLCTDAIAWCVTGPRAPHLRPTGCNTGKSKYTTVNGTCCSLGRRRWGCSPNLQRSRRRRVCLVLLNMSNGRPV